MKVVKRLSAIAISVLLVLAMTVTAFAASPDEVLTHSYKAYQVFSGTAADGKFESIAWGSDIGSNANSFIADLKGNTAFGSGRYNAFYSAKTAEDVARILEENKADYDFVQAFVETVENFPELGAGRTVRNNGTIANGYYLFVDTNATGTKNASFIKPVTDGVVKIEVKVSVPQVEKKVKEETYSTDYQSTTIGTEDAAGNFVGLNYGEGYNDVADYDIGDDIDFRLYGTLPNTFDDYTSYYYSFQDSLSKGLTVDESSIKVTMYNYNNARASYVGTDVTGSFNVKTTTNARTGVTQLDVTCDNVKAIRNVTKSSIFVVDYVATLNEDAVIGYNGNLNTVVLEYSNNPNNSGKPEDGGDTDKTEEDVVVVFTYELDIVKTDSADATKTLAGATFFIKNQNGQYFAEVAGKPAWVADQKAAKAFITDSTGLAVAQGLDDGTYTITEFQAPDGYKMLSGDFDITITATILPDNNNDECQTWDGVASTALTNLGVAVSKNVDNAVSSSGSNVANGTVEIEVANTKVFDLPGTGGMGTTIIYVTGSILVAGAVLMLIARRVKR